MNLKPLSVLPLLFLTACGVHFAKGALPVSDLDALEANVRKTTGPTVLPNGKAYCGEDARTDDAQDDCIGDLEDGLYNANAKAGKTRQTVHNFIVRERLRRNPCNVVERLFSKRCKVK